MIKQVAWAAVSLLDLVGLPSKPVILPTERKHDTTPLPNISAALKAKKVAKPRKKHVCQWTDQEVWGAVIFAFLLGAFIMYCIR
jgi:hypothetical protein